MIEKKIKCLIVNGNEINTYCVEIYNYKWELIHSCNMNDEYICQVFPCCGNYKILIKNNKCDIFPRTIVQSMYIDNNTNDLVFHFYKYALINKKTPVIINLTDQNYNGLPIMKGEIILWQHM